MRPNDLPAGHQWNGDRLRKMVDLTGRLFVLTFVFCAVADVRTEAANAVTVNYALNDIIGNNLITENVFGVRLRARTMAPEARFAYLRNWVLPSGEHDSIRLSAKLTPADPVVPMLDDHPFDLERLRVGTTSGLRRIHTGGNLVSPAYDLVETAKELGRLQELLASVQGCTVHGEVQERCKLVLLVLTAMAMGEAEAAGSAADELYDRHKVLKFSKLADRWPETLFVWAAAENRMLLAEAESILVEMMEAQIRSKKFHGPHDWDLMIQNLAGRVRFLSQSDSSEPTYTTAPALQTWHPAGLISSWSHGNGVPAEAWQLDGGVVRNTSSRSAEYLLFGIPLRGDYVVECDCTGFGYRDSHPSVAGTWIAPIHHHKSLAIGGLLTNGAAVPLNPKLSRVDDWMRYRIEMRDGSCSRFINGRLVHHEKLPKNHEPWLAIRSPNYGSGNVRDVRITGNPTIPEKVNLSEVGRHTLAESIGKPAFPEGWMPWIQDVWKAENSTWRTTVDDAGATVFVGQHRPELFGTSAERLFFYHWPIVFDAEISYEFFYREGTSHVHPALGRRAFLLNRDGTETHWVTNGTWDPTDLAPGNRTTEVSSTGDGTPLPLLPNAWNRVSLQLNGDTVAVTLNDELVCRSDLHPTNNRTFGLFHFCDQTEARVRNIVLQGNWPRTLPPLQEQELRGTQTDELDQQRLQLTATFDYDFTNVTPEQFQTDFTVVDSYAGKTSDIELQKDGLHIEVKAAAGSGNVGWVAPRMGAVGDFDIIAEFAGLDLKVSDNGSSAIYLTTSFSGSYNGIWQNYRGVIQHPDTPRRQIVQTEIFDLSPERQGWRYGGIYAEACMAGRLRIARRGRKLMFLIAEHDSERFRLTHTEDVTGEPLSAGSIWIRGSCYSTGAEDSSVAVVWKNIHVRAAQIIDLTSAGAAPDEKAVPNPENP